MIGRPSCRLRLDAAKAQAGQVKFIDKGVDRPDRIVLAQIVIQPFGKQSALTAVVANDKARLESSAKSLENHIIEGRFHTAWVKDGSGSASTLRRYKVSNSGL
jgi:hypothetical protein